MRFLVKISIIIYFTRITNKIGITKLSFFRSTKNLDFQKYPVIKKSNDLIN